MGYPVRNFDEFRKGLREAKQSARLSGFLLFDASPSQATISRFAEQEFKWLDDIARALEIFVFLFIAKEEGTGKIINPSLEVAKLFGIKIAELPGIVFFSDVEETSRCNRGVFVPLQAKAFDDSDSAEKIVREIFSVVEAVLSETLTGDLLISRLEAEFKQLRARKKFEPLANYLGDILRLAVEYPKKFIDALGDAFAKEMAARLSGQGPSNIGS